MRELQVPDEKGEMTTLTIFPGILGDGTQMYQEFNKQGFLSDAQGNLIDEDGTLMVSATELATLINKYKRGEPVDMPEGKLVTIIFEEGDEIKPDGEKIFELDPSAELADGETMACHSCSRALGFRFEELWGGEDCSCSTTCACQ